MARATEESTIACEVTIVGGGPVGVGLAIDLAQRGVDVAVIERHDVPQRIPKGQNLTQRTMEHMRAWGVEDAIRAARTIPPGWGIGGLTAYGTLMSGRHHDWLVRANVAPYYAAANERLPQYATEGVLRERLAALPHGRLLTGLSVSGLTQDDHGVDVTAEDRDGAPRRVRATYVVGCDGARSATRRLAGIGERRTDHDRLMALVVFRSPAFFEMLRRFEDKQFYCVLDPALDGYWKFFGMVDWGETCFFHRPVALGTTPETLDPVGLLHDAIGEPVPVEIEHVGLWELRVAVAERYQAGRVFLAGDAAHSHPPYGGYGINTGLEDARNLGWKLAVVLRGEAPERLLDSYDAERRPVFESTARDFIEAMIEADRAFLRAHDPEADPEGFETAWAERAQGGSTAGVARFAPHYEGSPIVDGPEHGPPSALGSHDFAARPGRHLAPRALTGGRPATDHLSEHFTLLALDADADAFRRAAQDRALPLAVHAAPRDGEAADYGAGLILVRPDGFVAWTGETATDAGAVLDRATARADLDVAKIDVAGIGLWGLAAVGIALLLGGIAKGATGAGAPVVAIPVIAAVTDDVRLAVIVMLMPNLLTNLWQALHHRRDLPPDGFARTFALGGALGAAVGTVMLATLPTRTLTALVAAAVVAYVALRIARPDFVLDRPLGRRLAPAMGTAGGILQGAAGISAPVSVSFLNALRLDRPAFVATIAVFFFSMAAVQAVAIPAAGLMSWGLLALSLAACLPQMAAMPVGAALARRLSARAFDRVILVLLAVLAVELTWDVIAG